MEPAGMFKRTFSVSWHSEPWNLQFTTFNQQTSTAVDIKDRSAEINQVSRSHAVLTLVRTARNWFAQWHPASVKHGAGNVSVLDRTCRSLSRLAQMRWEHVAAWLSSSLANRPVDRHSSRRGWRRTSEVREPLWRRSRHLASVGYGVVDGDGNGTWHWVRWRFLQRQLWSDRAACPLPSFTSSWRVDSFI